MRGFAHLLNAVAQIITLFAQSKISRGRQSNLEKGGCHGGCGAATNCRCYEMGVDIGSAVSEGALRDFSSVEHHPAGCDCSICTTIRSIVDRVSCGAAYYIAFTVGAAGTSA